MIPLEKPCDFVHNRAMVRASKGTSKLLKDRRKAMFEKLNAAKLKAKHAKEVSKQEWLRFCQMEQSIAAAERLAVQTMPETELSRLAAQGVPLGELMAKVADQTMSVDALTTMLRREVVLIQR